MDEIDPLLLMIGYMFREHKNIVISELNVLWVAMIERFDERPMM